MGNGGGSLFEQAYEMLRRALEASGVERTYLIDEAVRLHQLAKSEPAPKQPRKSDHG
jgi:hypothetical protein